MSKARYVASTVFHHLERMIGRKVLVIVEPEFGFEGEVVAVSKTPPGLYLSGAEAVILRSTLGRPVPEVVGREEKSEIFVNLNHVQRIELLHQSPGVLGQEEK